MQAREDYRKYFGLVEILRICAGQALCDWKHQLPMQVRRRRFRCVRDPGSSFLRLLGWLDLAHRVLLAHAESAVERPAAYSRNIVSA